MIHNIRAAIAAIATLALSACATPVKTAETDFKIAEAPAPEVETKTGEEMNKNTTEGTDAAIVPQNETLLYGAMTKYELMSFVEAIGTAKLTSVFESEKPMTVFAPNNQAFEIAGLGQDADIAEIIKGHVVPGAMDLAALRAAVKDSGAPVPIMSKAGTELTIYIMDDKVRIAGPNGSLATITQVDMMQSNGVMHQINSVLKPK